MRTPYFSTFPLGSWRFSDSPSEQLSDSNPLLIGSESVKSVVAERRLTTTLASGTTSAVQKQKQTLEQDVFKLKLQWMIAKNDDEKRRISEEIRRRIDFTPSMAQ